MENRTTGPPTGEEPVKECPRARSFEVHKAHPWQKREGWPLWCDGILPLAEQPPCQFYVSPEQPECGEPSPTTIRVKTSLIDARVDVCITHKKMYDSRAASQRTRHATRTDTDLRHAS